MQKTVDRKRFYLAMIISGAILFVWQIFFAPDPPPRVDTQTAENSVAGSEDSAAQKSADAADSEGSQPAQDSAANADPAQAEAREIAVRNIAVREDTLAGTNLKISLTNKEASVTSVRIIELEQYAGTGPEDKPGDLIGFPADAPQYPFRIDFVGKGLSLPEGSVYEVVESASEKSSEGVYSKLVYRYEDPRGDRKSTRLNSSHVRISYAVFCLKKKKPGPGAGPARAAVRPLPGAALPWGGCPSALPAPRQLPLGRPPAPCRTG